MVIFDDGDVAFAAGYAFIFGFPRWEAICVVVVAVVGVSAAIEIALVGWDGDFGQWNRVHRALHVRLYGAVSGSGADDGFCPLEE